MKAIDFMKVSKEKTKKLIHELNSQKNGQPVSKRYINQNLKDKIEFVRELDFKQDDMQKDIKPDLSLAK